MKFPSNVNIATFNCSVFKWLDSQHLWNKIFHHLIYFSGGIFWTTNQIEAILSQRHNIMTRITTNNIFKINAPKKTYYHIHRFSPTLVKCSLFRRRVPANPHWLRSWHHGIDDDCWRAAKVTRSELWQVLIAFMQPLYLSSLVMLCERSSDRKLLWRLTQLREDGKENIPPPGNHRTTHLQMSLSTIVAPERPHWIGFLDGDTLNGVFVTGNQF